MNLDYFIKTDKAYFPDIFWNIPEQKTGVLQVVGGNINGFKTEFSQTETMVNNFPLKEVRLLLPDALRTKIPPIPGINFAPSTESGSFDKSDELKFAVEDADITLFSGDFTKNSKTAVALTKILKETTKPAVLARDTIDVVSESAEEFIEKGNITLVATMAQLQKLFRNLLYPKMILLSSPLMPIVETLHKFTLSYPVTIFTFHADYILVASVGKVIATPISATNFTPLGLFIGDIPSKIAALELWNPSKHFESSHSSIFWDK
ncbi:hypothetical protein IJ768_00705 [Candidatus Saccharibacteria bacterium]|nr:hypothetical protein [Candidatus Saccharibacteria bacterium]